MAPSEKHRSRFDLHFVEHVGDEAAEAMPPSSPPVMTRMPWAVGMGFGFVAVLSTVLAVITK